ncbi:MAG: hypothetical protein AAB393_12860, partial [Bacteroidota bacterium]
TASDGFIPAQIVRCGTMNEVTADNGRWLSTMFDKALSIYQFWKQKGSFFYWRTICQPEGPPLLKRVVSSYAQQRRLHFFHLPESDVTTQYILHG